MKYRKGRLSRYRLAFLHKVDAVAMKLLTEIDFKEWHDLKLCKVLPQIKCHGFKVFSWLESMALFLFFSFSFLYFLILFKKMESVSFSELLITVESLLEITNLNEKITRAV